MTLQTFCDLVWLEIWEDCPPMGDHGQYRDIVTKIFLECKEPWEISYTTYDDKGKKVTKRLGPRPAAGAAPGSSQTDAAKALLAKIGKGVSVNTRQVVEQVQAAKEAAELASPPSE